MTSPLQLLKSPRNQTWDPELGTKRGTRRKTRPGNQIMTHEPSIPLSCVKPFRSSHHVQLHQLHGCVTAARKKNDNVKEKEDDDDGG